MQGRPGGVPAHQRPPLPNGPGHGKPKGVKNKIRREDIERYWRHIIEFNPRVLLKKTGWGKAARFTLKEFYELPDEAFFAMESFDVVTQNLTAGDGQQETIVKVRWYNRPEVLRDVAKHLGMLKEHVAIEVLEERKARLREGLARAATLIDVEPVRQLLDAPDAAAVVPSAHDD